MDAVLGHIPKIIEEMMEKHKEMAYIEKLPEKEILYQMEALAPVFFEFDVLLSKPFIILMEGCKGTKYENYSKRLFELASSHMEEHLGSGNQVMAEIIAQSFITTLLGIGKRKECLEEKKKALLKYTEIIILGILASKMND